MSILQNAIDSIEVGLEDYKSADPKRLVSSVRNFYAGILLLFKHKLAELSKNDDEALIKKKVVPNIIDGKLRWVGSEGNTVDVQQIQERFKSLGIRVSWKEFNTLQAYRNNIEHYYSEARPENVQQYVAECFLVIRNFIVDHLDDDPKEMLGETTWKCLVAEEGVYRAEREACLAELARVDWEDPLLADLADSFECAECGSNLIEPIEDATDDTALRCRVCSNTMTVEEVVPTACSNFNRTHDYHEVKYGGDHSFVICPECGNETYSTVEDHCVQANCDCTGPFECERCGNTITPDEFEYGETTYCGYCDYQMSRDRD